MFRDNRRNAQCLSPIANIKGTSAQQMTALEDIHRYMHFVNTPSHGRTLTLIHSDARLSSMFTAGAEGAAGRRFYIDRELALASQRSTSTVGHNFGAG